MLDLVEGVGSSDGIGATARRLVLEAVAAGEVPADGPLPLDADAAAVFAAARAGDRVALAIVDRLGDRLARVCVLLASLLDIDRVVVAGAIARPAAAVIDRARRCSVTGTSTRARDRRLLARGGRGRHRGGGARGRRRAWRPAVVPAPAGARLMSST
ncbi:ROK family protein [Curtobacterium pusillum]|uniref:ROK family protein n=1 Tax=Curtobacterium pusillum TaxID=69373 RepID=UPI0031DAB574